MKYQYYNLSSEQFEELVIAICARLFGVGVQGFTNGKDGGRDGRFAGIADLYPSKREPWKGITIIQAKHTSGINRSFSDNDFFSNKTSLINKEIPKIKKLVENAQLDNYILFSNRKLSGGIVDEIIEHISNKTGLDKSNIALCGIDDIERYLKMFKEIPSEINLNPFDAPLVINPEDLADVIAKFAKLPDAKDVSNFDEIKRTGFDDKNKKNKLSAEYAKIIKNDMLFYYEPINKFLALPENEEFKKMYEATIADINAKIAVYLKELHSFDIVLDKFYDIFINLDPDLKKHKRLTRIFLHYMYYFCDIGGIK